MDGSKAMRDAIQRELRRSLMVPVIRDTDQQSITSPTNVGRTGTVSWLISYRAADDLLPDECTQPWTPYAAGNATAQLTTERLRIAAPAATDSLYYRIAQAQLSNTRGVLYEASVRMNTSESAANQGAALTLFDGAWQWTCWVRVDGLNLDGEPSVAFDFAGGFHRIVIVTQGMAAQLFLDGQWVQSGGPTNVTTQQAATFGSWIAKE
jgi:hypothetical protein